MRTTIRLEDGLRAGATVWTAKIARAVTVGLCLAVIGGCSGGVRRAPPTTAPTPVRSEDHSERGPDRAEGNTPERTSRVVHRVGPGETLWSIARAYDQTVGTIAEANGLVDVDRIRVGQGLLIPGATELRVVTPPGLHGQAASPSLAWPLRGELLSPYGAPRGRRRHAGVDIRGTRGEPVIAAASGRVVFSSKMQGYGKVVILDHGDGLETVYAHCAELLVRVGDRVARGQRIAKVGRTGNATTEHCHFEVRRNDVAVDPLRYLSRHGRTRSAKGG